MELDGNFIFIGCQNGDVLIWEKTLCFTVQKIKLNQECINMYWYNNKSCLIIVSQNSIIIYDYVTNTYFKVFIYSQ